MATSPSSELSVPPYFSRTSSLRRSSKKKQGFAAHIRAQLGDQLKCLENKLEIQVAIVAELQEFFKRRAEVELEYSKNLDKLVRQMITRHRAEKQNRQEQWATFSTFACWKHLLGITRKESQDHNTISELYSTHVMNRLNETIENSQRIFKKCREIGAESHEDMLKVLNELQSSMKTYHIYQSESKQAETKLRTVESQKMKVEQQLSGKNTTSRKLKGLERQAEKRQAKYSENKLKSLKARNDYLLCIEASNSAITKYFSDDISDLMDCMDFGYHNSVGRTMMMYLSVHEQLKQTHQSAIESINKNISDLDSRADKQKFMELNNQVFMLPKKFEFQPYKGDEDVKEIQIPVRQISAQKPVQDDLVQRYQSIGERLASLTAENNEIWKTLETTEKALVDLIQVKDYDVSKFFREENPPPKSPHEDAKHRNDRQETEGFYLLKFREYTLSCNRLARLQSKYNSIQKALGEKEISSGANRPPALPPKPQKRRIGRTPPVGQPKLFGGSLEEYCEALNIEIPRIIRSCIRVVNLYGMHHQGIFRVSGAQLDINQFKNSFETGEDPLMDTCDSSDINSVAGVLKLYFRELREPLFPLHLFEELVACARDADMPRRVERLRDLLSTLPRCVIIVMRYLFSFLHHLSEYSDENMMDPYNLAICFGPTLLPIPPDRDQVSFQGSVNEIIKSIIHHQEELFPNDGGETYEKCILEDTSNDNGDDDETSSIPSDEEEPELLEATALYDFEGRTGRELSFKKGDVLMIYSQVSNDWWEGCCHGQEGLIPDKYISLVKQGSIDEPKSVGSEDSDKTSSTQSLPIKPPIRQSSEETTIIIEKPVEKSVSQPNIVVRETDIIDVDDPVVTQPAPPKTTVPTSKAPSLQSVEEIDSPPDAGDPPKELKRQMSSPDSTADDISVDIDNALEEVMAGLKSLEIQQRTAKRMSLPVVKNKQIPKHTPDLVLDLPEGSDSPPSHESSEPDSPTISAAETFAKSNQGTLKKANSMPRNISTTNRITDNSDKGDNSDLPPPPPLSTFSTSAGIVRRSQTTPPTIRSKSVTDAKMDLPPLGTSPVPPPVAEKPKPPVKVKPPVMKKPGRSPEVVRKFPKPESAQETPPKVLK